MTHRHLIVAAEVPMAAAKHRIPVMPRCLIAAVQVPQLQLSAQLLQGTHYLGGNDNGRVLW